MARHQLEPVGKCWGPNCVTIGYSIVGKHTRQDQQEHDYIDEIMRDVATDNEMIF